MHQAHHTARGPAHLLAAQPSSLFAPWAPPSWCQLTHLEVVKHALQAVAIRLVIFHAHNGGAPAKQGWELIIGTGAETRAVPSQAAVMDWPLPRPPSSPVTSLPQLPTCGRC
jgi:hypothetical protein